MKISKFDQQYQSILNNGLKYIMKKYDNVNYDKDNVIDLRDQLITFEKPFKLPLPYKRFHIFYVRNNELSTKTKTYLNLILADNKEKQVTYFCTRNIKWCSIKDPKVFVNFIKKNLGQDWRVNYIAPYFTESISRFGTFTEDVNIFKLEFKHLLWTFFWISLKLKNPKISDDVLFDYFILNVSKRKDIKNLLKDFYEKINK